MLIPFFLGELNNKGGMQYDEKGEPPDWRNRINFGDCFDCLLYAIGKHPGVL